MKLINKIIRILGLTPEIKVDMLNFKPGDKLLVALSPDASSAHIEQIQRALSEFEMVDKRFLLMQGIKKVIIVRPDGSSIDSIAVEGS